MSIGKHVAAVALLAASLVAPPLVASAQTELPKGVYRPADHGADNPEFAAYRAKLILAAKRRDVEAVVRMTAPNIKLSFGGDEGHEALRKFLTSREYPLWSTLVDVLENGAWRNKDGTYAAPYWFSMPTKGAYDPFTTAFVPAWGVILRDAPDRTGRKIGSVSYGFVEIRKPYLEAGKEGYQAVRTENGVEGYLHTDYLRSVVAHRAGFQRFGSGWKMTFFIAGD
ncbi:MAG: SH3 domain-containing protein [Neomegalonema sp.]|nr:SH3 domain-containing protein [Neomegalonema sp.]